MEKLLVLLILFSGCYSQTQDLSGKMLVFPKTSSTDYAKLKPKNTNFGLRAMTVCLRFYSGGKAEQTLFSMADKWYHNSPLLYKRADRYEVYMRVSKCPLVFWGLPNELNKWHSYCFTWDSGSGLVQLWVDGISSAKQMAYKLGFVSAEPCLILGQDQDNYGCKFDESESFLGHITDVHVWDKVISDCDIQLFTSRIPFTPGNVINWFKVDLASYGDVVLEKMADCAMD